jgi:hypothetical protein
MSAVEKQFQDAIKAMNGGKPLEAERLFKNILRTHSKERRGAKSLNCSSDEH